MLIFLLFLAMIFNIIAQVVLKHGVNLISLSGLNINAISKMITSPFLWSGAIMYGVSFVFYIFALSRGELGKISPVSQALTTLGVVTVSILIFHEPITASKIFGIVLLIAGTLIIFK